MLHRFALFLAALFLPAAAAAQATTNVVIATELGDIVVALETERAPITAANFLRYADEKRFDGIVFYRAMKLDSMARNEPGTANGDWSIMLAPQPGLDADPASEDPELRAGYAAFGRVIEGMDVVRAIFEAPTDPDKGEGWMKGQMLASPVKVTSVRRQSTP